MIVPSRILLVLRDIHNAVGKFIFLSNYKDCRTKSQTTVLKSLFIVDPDHYFKVFIVDFEQIFIFRRRKVERTTN